MPKFGEGALGTKFGYQIDKTDGIVGFDDKTHTYFDLNNGEQYISVTQLISKYEQPFDEDFWSSYKALESLLDGDIWGITKTSLLSTKKFDDRLVKRLGIDEVEFYTKKQEILDEYASKREESCQHGTQVHLSKELAAYRDGGKFVKPFGITGDFICTPGDYNIDPMHGMYPEILISWKFPNGLRISGQVDLLICDDNYATICDYKGLDINTEIPTIDGFKFMKDITEGDILFDQNGDQCKVIHKSEIHNNPCYKIKFDNNDEIIADEDHRWKIFFDKRTPEKIMTTEELKKFIDSHERVSQYVPKIKNPKPLNCDDLDLPIDPYVLGVWLGDGTSSAGAITQRKGSPVWDELKKRGEIIGQNLIHDPKRENVETRTLFGLLTRLRKINLFNNKHIPEIYYRASYKQRLDLLRGLMDTDGYYHPTRHRFVMGTAYTWQSKGIAELVSTLGLKPTMFNVIKTCKGKKFPGYDTVFTTDELNPFLTRNQNICVPIKHKCYSYRRIMSIESIDTVPTQCIEVDSPTHTYLCTRHCIVTHNSNREIKMKSYYNKSTKKSVMMKYPMQNYMDTNYYRYQAQLSMYMYLLQQKYPQLQCKKLFLLHIDRDGKETEYPVEYIKDDIAHLINHYAKSLRTQEALAKDNPIRY